MKQENDDGSDESLNSRMFALEKRLSRIEAHLGIASIEKDEEYSPPLPPQALPPVASEEDIESAIGEFWFAKIGIVVLAVGIVFLLSLPYSDFPVYLPSAIGYVIAGGIFLFSYMMRDSFAFLSRYLLGGCLALTYFATMRLHYFTAQPAITERSIVVALLAVVAGGTIFIAAKRKSVYLSALTLFMGFVTVILSGNAYVQFAGTVVLSLLVVYFVVQYEWHYLAYWGMFLSYCSLLLWFMNNPFLTSSPEWVHEPRMGVFVVLCVTLIYALAVLFRKERQKERVTSIISSALNCGGGYSLFLLMTMTSFRDMLTPTQAVASLLFLAFSVLLWLREESRYSTFFYAMTGYTALSVALLGGFEPPDVFIYLSWQSILVVSTAIWFRSKYIIVANFFIYLITFVAYLTVTNEIGGISLGFGIVALLSARILNAQRH